MEDPSSFSASKIKSPYGARNTFGNIGPDNKHVLVYLTGGFEKRISGVVYIQIFTQVNPSTIAKGRNQFSSTRFQCK